MVYRTLSALKHAIRVGSERLCKYPDLGNYPELSAALDIYADTDASQTDSKESTVNALAATIINRIWRS